VFDLNFTKLLVLGVIALVVFGPERLPAIAAQVGRAVRELHRLADGAKAELQENLGPELSQFDLADLNPRHFVRKHLVDELTGDGVLRSSISDVRSAVSGGAGTIGASTSGGAPVASQAVPVVALAAGESPPYDAEAT
jgi:sec-independent protein translocase protein TatB